MKTRLKNLISFVLALALLFVTAIASAAGNIKIAIDAEFGIPNSTSAQAVRHGAQVAVNEINAAGGVLGRKLEVIERDNRAVPARSLNNLRELAADPDVVAVMCGRYSPVVVEMLPEIHRLKMLMLDPWAAADAITENDFTPNYVFRLSLRDSWALPVMMRHALKQGHRKVGILLPSTEWGRSSLKAAEETAAKDTHQEIVASKWYNWGDASLIERYQALRNAGAQAVILVANDREGVILAKEMASLPSEQRLPLVAHWGITGGNFFEQSGAALKSVDLSVVQTYSFIGKSDPKTKGVLAGLKAVTGSDDPRKVASPVGVAHAYDLVHLLALAIKKANSTDRSVVRQALENLGPYKGLVRPLDKPFTAKRHDALSINEVFMARFADDGAIEPILKTKP
ncbi:ABC transporter substrate-binding protein [Rhodoferax sp.]|uniref:ABC transporter substrate-binding protein n=1 Tax=Rhodoferax sp. TaxID=50421 RepID=UPI002727A949|nr:ABC transporter substrate-binding protein [Rhodoferax sp.]MDO9144872.1 ABC transporter substrate-binding protein [Rhodoferax sp.]MDP1530542.1 ABC transporter substrate-binding protein [Rhodoferax sp.]MDP1944605.1 ABC transporter substrate-binding protein [Rhodoferax sp.]MDP2440610.1 ABC transporter substrate-binding protein [Rhodoferax sp.]MDP3192169.1 ABC transporter substrate-binding protein [Rhodoferax sp.]